MTRLACFVAVLLTTACAGAEEAPGLAWKLEKGSVLRYRHTSDQVAIHTGAGSSEPASTKQKTSIDYRLSVLDFDPATRLARVLCRYDAVSVELEQMVIGLVQWDSRKREDLSRADDPAVRPFAQLLGQSFSFLLSPAGEVSDLRGHEKVREAVIAGLEDSPFARTAIGGSFSEDALRFELQRAFAFVPTSTAEAARPEWRRSFERKIVLLGTLSYDLRYRREPAAATGTAIAFTGELRQVAPPGAVDDPIAAQTTVTFEGGKVEGTAIFDPAHGRLERAQAVARMKVTTRVGNVAAPDEGPGAASASTDVTQTIAIERLPD
jgi:hypothetical protein